MTEPQPHHDLDATDHLQSLYLMNAVLPETSGLSDEQVLTLFRAANIAVARVMIAGDPGSLRFLEDYMARADYFGTELQQRHHRNSRK